MPKIRWHELPMGAMHRFKDHRFEDMTPMSLVSALCKADRLLLCDPSSTGRKKRLTNQRIYSKLIRAMWKHAIDRMMEGDRFVINEDVSMYIGRVPKDKNHYFVKSIKKRYLSSINTHGLILNGFFHNYYFRMPGWRRKQLRNKLKQGQSYIS